MKFATIKDRRRRLEFEVAEPRVRLARAGKKAGHTSVAGARELRKYRQSRLRNRCVVTGRSRAVFRRWRVGRRALRARARRGEVSGRGKLSW